MSHIRRNSARKSKSIRVFLYGCLFIFLFTFIEVFSGIAHAATTSNTNFNTGPHYILKSSLSDLSSDKQAILDWRTQSYELKFNLPAYDWYETLELFLSAYPEGPVNRHAPLMISYNGAAPIALNGQGSRFDAHIRLDPSRIRATNNSIKISYKIPKDQNCLTDQDGKWVLDIAHSKLVAKARAKKRALYISEVEQRLAHPMTSPNRIAILAKGNNANALEAILAQALAQRTHTLPQFQFSEPASDFTVLAGTPSQLRALVKNKDLLGTKVPSIFVDTGLRPKLVLSAPTDAQVLELARAFATYHLPSSRRTSASLYELYSNTKLDQNPVLRAQNYKISDIGNIALSPSWRPEPATLDFNVEDPQASTAELTLHIATSANINPNSKLNVHLNQHSLGYTYLNKKTKRVSFEIAPGMLKASGNQLTISPAFEAPEIKTNTADSKCLATNFAPAITFGKHSKLVIKTKQPTSTLDLSRLLSNGAPFTSDNGQTALMLTARSDKDRAATLHLLGFAARQFGPQWVYAEYYTQISDKTMLTQNILMIGPNMISDPSFMAAAPSAFRLAMNGKVFEGADVRKMAMLERHAALDADMAFKIAARNLGMPSRISAGGIASIFPSPYAEGKTIGVISSTKPSHFARAMKSLSSPTYWNALQGSVMRWDDTAVLMAQIAPVVAGSARIHPAPSFSWQHMKNVNIKAKLGAWISGFTRAKAKPLPPQQIGASLRGNIETTPVPILKSTALEKGTKKGLSNTASFSTNLKASLQQKTAAFKASLVALKPEGVSGSTFRAWVSHMKTNRLVWLILGALACFLAIATACPKDMSLK
ncbi:MAG: hypothetical protein COA69_01705 [Robiginitomaculum sp.]|nr:MAG: hypothetical protein COA69_01705 [Robiginitomaculum sp.]